MSGLPGGHPSAASLAANSTVLSDNVTQFLSDTAGGTTSGRPLAFVNWVLFDNQFNYVAESSGFQQVGADNALTAINKLQLPVTKSGYLYIYLSNETPNVDVFFDNLQVTHKRGPLLEEDHYYPFGLTMAGISDKALKGKYAENKYRYNKKELENGEFSDGSGLDEYNYGARMYIPQLGRWSGVDRKADKFVPVSPYSYVVNNPLLLVDPSGKDWTISIDVKKGVFYFHIHFTGAVVDKTKAHRGQAEKMAAAIKYQFEALFNSDHADDKNGGFVVDATADVRAVSNEDDIHSNESIFKKEDKENPDLNRVDENGQVHYYAAQTLNGKEIAINADYVNDILSGKNKKTMPHEMGHSGGLSHPEDNQGFFGWFFVAPDQDLTRAGRNFMFGGGTSGDDLNKNPTGPTKAQLMRIYLLYTSGKLNSYLSNPVDAF